MFGTEREEQLKIALAEVLGISPQAIEILNVFNAYDERKRRRKLLATTSDKIEVNFKVNVLNDADASGLSASLMDVSKSTLVSKLQEAGLTEVTEEGFIAPTTAVFYAPPPPPFAPPRPPSSSSSSSSDNTTLIGAAVGAITLPGIILFVMKIFARKALRAGLLQCGLRRLADMLVPDTQGTMKEFNVKIKDVEAFMSKQKLPRLVDTTPVLDENNVSVNSSKALGRGGFGVVYKGTLKRSSTGTSIAVAVKCMFTPSGNPKDAVVPDDIKKQMRRESTILCSLNHPNVMRLFGVCPSLGWIVMELCEKGSLKSILLAQETSIETSELTRYAAETATGVAYLHSPEIAIVHGDLKADNVLVRSNGSVCLCDFGMSEAKDRSKTMTQTLGASVQNGLTVQWSSPELLKGERKDRASDIFALAVTLWEIFERKTPFAGMADMIVINQILANVRPKIEKTPAEFRALIQQAWMDDAKSRPNAAQIAYALSN